jgi:hypothetical protein
MVWHSQPMASRASGLISVMSCSICAANCIASSNRIASDMPQAIASRALIWGRISSGGKARSQASSASSSPRRNSAIAQFSIQGSAALVSPTATA